MAKAGASLLVVAEDVEGEALATLVLENVTLDQLGRASRVVVSREHTTLIGGKGDANAIDGRCHELRAQIADSTSDYDREKLEERLAKLAGGVAVIRVGAPSEAEMKSRKEAYDDAIHATRAAMAEGIVPGAGLALLRTIPPVDAAAGDQRSGMLTLRRALEAPPGRLPRTPAWTTRWWWRRCARAPATSGSTRGRGATWTWWTPAPLSDAA